jgi:MFS transporter, DHA1 family, multidrug resistance protein
MTENIVDRDIERAQVQATRTWSARSSLERQREFEATGAARGERGSLSSSSSSSVSSHANRLSAAATASLARSRTHPLEQHRTETHRLQHSQTVGAHPTKSRLPKELPNFGGGKEFPPPLPEREEYVVEYDGKDDPLHPQNWKFSKK